MERTVGVVILNGLVFAGGASTRFGSDKFVYPWEGLAMGLRAARALLAVCNSAVWLQGGTTLHEEVVGLASRTGPREGSGPLGALADAEPWCDGDVLLTMPCDVPRFGANELQQLVDALGPDHDVAFAQTQGEDGAGATHWLLGAWRRDTVAKACRSFDAGERSVHGFAATLFCSFVEFDEAIVQNVNERPL